MIISLAMLASMTSFPYERSIQETLVEPPLTLPRFKGNIEYGKDVNLVDCFLPGSDC